MGASAELDALAEELILTVRLMDGTNRYRFANDPQSLAQWESARNVVGPPRTGGRAGDEAAGGTAAPRTPPQAGEIKPAA